MVKNISFYGNTPSAFSTFENKTKDTQAKTTTTPQTTETTNLPTNSSELTNSVSPQISKNYFIMQAPPQKEKKESYNKIQLASLLVGTLASAAFFIYLSKGLFSYKNNKLLLKDIQNSDMPDNVKNKLLEEYKKMSSSFMDVDGSQKYINNMLKLNWSKPERKIIDIEKAQKILDKDHIGLKQVKDEVISFLKVQNYNLKHNLNNDGPLVLCLDGPPGVGKTSIAESIAKSMDLPFERISLAGISHKSFIKGEERLYKGAEPGQIIKAVQDSGVSNPVILLDEIDKMGSSHENGDPAFALLDALEPKQCKKFTDENLGVPYDLSNVTFVITSNDLRNIPDVLKDRLSVIHIPAYSNAEKTDICKFNIKNMMEKNQITNSQVKFANDGIDEIVNRANDEGARKTIENLKSVFINIKQTLETKGNQSITVDKDFVADSLKNKKEDPLTDVAKSQSPMESLVEMLKDLKDKIQ